ncbi:Cyclic nucleotide-binding protein, putative hydrogenase accessory protein [Nitrospina gracilis 3/211]|uniref:Cyclic nucleotide-binding protein, putative hydrogenase accessory protein n=1 Tax=Nitrospina gracilis (strain 3/211) TaxID=1266370 RepID=M1YWT3_NITG3|nr:MULTISPECIES: cyclic nucleotide-binding domain-containing protein [Nitrospina]MCF8722989.1 CRP-like cAMP-binding protein [Nitrospina sp. Nb-3]CCQ89959.1 Cyclic nucleotide-binding protein, putative hydrogenase accessory protein [Nitrospina gracilis 3/211]
MNAQETNMKTLEPILSEHPFFDGLQEKYMKLVIGCASNVRFESGEFLFREGAAADHFYIIRHGRVALEMAPPNKPPMIVDTVEGGQVLGWSWLAPPHLWHFDAHAMTLVRTIALDAACLRKKIETDHELGYELFRRFFIIAAERLQHTRMQLMDVYGSTV